MTSSPLYRDTLALCGVLLEEMEGVGGFTVLRHRVAEGALRLLDEVTLALAGFDGGERVSGADAELQALRSQLHLAFEIGLLEEEVFLAVTEQSDTIGRQIGGWLKKVRRGLESQPRRGGSV